MLTVVADRSFDKDKVLVVDKNKMSLVPFRNRSFTDEDATLPG